jgi:N-methylhydantoinase A
MIVSDVRHDYMQAFATNTGRFDVAGVNQVVAELERKAMDDMIEEGFPEGEVTLSRFADAKYPAQIHELTIPVNSSGEFTEASIAEMEQTFHDLHERMFTYSVRESPVDLFHWRVVAHRKVDSPATPAFPAATEQLSVAEKTSRKVYFGDIDDYRETKIYDGDLLQRGMTVSGPAVVEQINTTIVVFPGQSLDVNEYGDFVLDL